MIGRIDNRSRYELVYEQIKNEIINDAIKPGTKLNIQDLCDQLGISKTPVVTAINALERDGYVVVIPQNGTYVRELSQEETAALYDLRIAVEKLTLEYAVKNIDRAILSEILENLKNLALCAQQADTDIIDEYFRQEMSMHDYFLSCCPPLMQNIAKNVVDLTKRTRLLSLTCPAGLPDDDKWLIDDISMHICIADAMLRGDLETAKQMTERDIVDTKVRILEILSKKEIL